MRKEKNLESIVNEHNLNTQPSTKKYLGWKLIGHGIGAAASLSTAYGLEQILGYGKAITSAATEVTDYTFDQVGFNTARYFSERKKPRYHGFGGISRYISDSVGYAVRHIPGALLGIGVAGLTTYGLSTLFQVPVYVAAIVPRAFEITTEILSSVFFTKRYRQKLAQPSIQPNYAK